MNSRPDLTVVTLTRSESTRLRATASSVEAQKGLLVQHIIINAGPGLSRSNRPQGPRVVVVDDAPLGIYEAMNHGLTLAEGSGIAFLNSGDTFTTATSAQTMVRLLGSTRWGFGALRVRRGNRVRTHRVARYRPLIHSLGLSFVPHPATVMDTEWFMSQGGFLPSLGIAADQAAILQAARESPPSVSAIVISEHLQDGVSAERTPREIAMNFALVRRAQGRVIAGSHRVDQAATSVVIAARTAHGWVTRSVTR